MNFRIFSSNLFRNLRGFPNIIFSRGYANSPIIRNPKEKLINCLNNEIKYEKSQMTEVEGAKDFLKTSGFSFQSIPEECSLTLTKEVGGLKISILYQAKEPQIIESEEEEDKVVNEKKKEGKMEEVKDIKEKEDDFQDSYLFNVKIVNISNHSAILFECQGINWEIHITNASYHENSETLEKAPTVERFNTKYFGPEFTRLDEKLQNAFHEYLNDFGINGKIVNFIEVTSIDKDEKLYVKWLENLKNFLEN